jgi:UV DNA damage repair endonuclease
MTVKRIGFACKWIDYNTQVGGISADDDCKKYNTSSTTVAWLNRQTPSIAEERLWDLMRRNIEATRLLVEKVGGLDEHLRMVRISSDVLPVFTERNWSYFWRLSDVRNYAEKEFYRVGCLARDLNVRLSFHPGQFCVLASDKTDIVDRSIAEFEYHATMARWMGYGQTFQDLKINVHIAGRGGAAGIKSAYPRLSTEARNCITIENEEITHGLDTCLELAELTPLVLDIHHHYIKTGEYIDPNDPRISIICDSWRGVRPTIHYSLSREDILVGHPTNQRPNLSILLANGHKKSKLRAHSNFMWNDECNQWALAHSSWADIMVEAKAKNLASFALAKRGQALGLL